MQIIGLLLLPALCNVPIVGAILFKEHTLNKQSGQTTAPYQTELWHTSLQLATWCVFKINYLSELFNYNLKCTALLIPIIGSLLLPTCCNVLVQGAIWFKEQAFNKQLEETTAPYKLEIKSQSQQHFLQTSANCDYRWMCLLKYFPKCLGSKNSKASLTCYIGAWWVYRL